MKHTTIREKPSFGARIMALIVAGAFAIPAYQCLFVLPNLTIDGFIWSGASLFFACLALFGR